MPHKRAATTLAPWLVGLALALSALAALVLWADRIDLPLAALFFDPALDRFPARGQWLPETLHAAISALGFGSGALLALTLLITGLRRKPLAGVSARALGFALACLLVGPVLIANTVLKDHWGRARPMQLAQFGGQAQFSPPLLMSNQCAKNCSFVSGDASVMFSFNSYAYLATSRRWRRRLFLGSLIAGAAGGALRIWMGAHFFSDVVFAGVLMLTTTALLHTLFYGWPRTRECWRDFAGPARS